eukprot:scaffold78159_cov64-Phaeocystis_antarctica.AAC.3
MVATAWRQMCSMFARTSCRAMPLTSLCTPWAVRCSGGEVEAEAAGTTREQAEAEAAAARLAGRMEARGPGR